MESDTTGPKSHARSTALVPALHALAVAPVVGAVVLVLITVGLAAMVVGAYSGVAGYGKVKQPGRGETR